MGAFSNLIIDSEENDRFKKRKKTKEDMINFIFICDQSFSKEEMKTWSLERIKNKYKSLKQARKERLDKEFKSDHGLARKRRRAYYD